MNRKDEDTLDLGTGDTAEETRFSLVTCLEDERTGCVAGQVPDGSVFLYVTNGEILAAHSAFDGDRLIRRLACWPDTTPAMVTEARAWLARGESLSDTLFSVAPEEIGARLLAERFRENVYRFVGSAVNADFEPMEAIFVDNIQVGHESRRLIEELLTLWSEQTAIEQGAAEITVRRHRPPADGDEDALLLLNTWSDGTLAEVLDRSPLEPGRTLEVINRLRAIGSLELIGAGESAGTDEVPVHQAWPSRPDSGVFGGHVDDEMGAFADHDTVREGGTFVSNLLDKVEVGVGEPVAGQGDDRDTLPGRDRNTPVMVIETVEADQATAKQAVSLNFSGPRLEDEDARIKVGVLNEVLAAVCAALDETHGPGRGASRVQLVVEGSPVPFSVLFKGCELGAAGTLSVDAVIRNLYRRPPAEHRHLINRGFLDLIERSLSVANDEVETDRFESLLESVAGYQGKIRV